MRKVFCDKIVRVIKSRRKLEEELNVKITNNGQEVSIEGKSEDEYFAEKVIEALDFGFPFSIAMLVKNENFVFEIINIKEHTKRKDLGVIRARIIGSGGKTLRTLNNLTKCYFELKDNSVGIIGDPEIIKNARDAVTFIIRGAKHSNVYSYVEKHHREEIFDLGLKEEKKKRK